MRTRSIMCKERKGALFFRNILPVFLMLIASAGCAFEVGQLNPSPNIAMTPRKQSLHFQIAPEVKDRFQVELASSSVEVTRWRMSLYAGYYNGLKDLFHLIKTPHQANYVIKVTKADLSFAPAAMGEGGVAAFWAHVVFRASLMDSSGNVVRVSAGTAQAKSAFISKDKAHQGIRSALETMYEMMARQLFSR